MKKNCVFQLFDFNFLVCNIFFCGSAGGLARRRIFEFLDPFSDWFSSFCDSRNTGFYSVFPHNFVWGSCFCFCIPPPPPPPPPPPASSHPPPHTLCQHTLCQHTLCQHTLCQHTLCPHTLCPHTLCQHTLCPHTLCQHTLCQHTLCPHTLCPHTLCPHTLCPHTLCQHTLCPHTLCQHTLCQHTLCPHTLCPHTLCQHTLCPHTLCQHTLCQHTLCQHTLCSHTLRQHTLCQHTFCSHTLCPHTLCPHTLCQHTLCPHTLCPHTLCQHTLCPHTLCQHTLCQNTLCQHTLCSHTLRQHTLCQHTFCSHTLCPHTLCPHTLCQHTLCPHTLCQHTLCQHIVHTHTHTLVLRGRRGTHGTVWRAWSGFVARGAAALCVAGVALGDIHLRFTWQAWHKLPSTVVLRGRRGTHGTVWRAWSGFVARGAAALCVAGVALGDIHLRFTWQAWHKLPSTVVLRGRRGTHGTVWRAWSGFVARGAAALCVAGVALGDIHLRFTWQAWHKLASTVGLRGRRGTHGTVWRAWSGFVARGAAALCVAGVALGDIHLRFTWQAWHKLASTVNLRGRRGTHGTVWRAWSGFVARGAAALCVAGVALGDIHLRFTWQAWHKLTSTVVLRGRRGTHGTVWRAWSGFVARGAAAFWHFSQQTFCQHTFCHHTLCQHILCPHILCPHTLCHHTLCPHTLYQQTLCQHTLSQQTLCQHTFCHHTLCQHILCHHTLCPHTLCPHTLCPHTLYQQSLCHHTLCHHTLCHHTRCHHHFLTTHSFCVAGVALMVLGGALGPGFGACDAAPLCVAGVAQPDIHRRFTWQAWHKLTSTVVSRGRRGTYGTGWRPWARIWRLWRRATLRGRRGTTWHPLSFHVAGVAQTHIYRRFAWQAWHLWYWVAPLGPDLAPVTPRHFAWQAWHNLTSTFVSCGRRGTNSHLPSFCVAGVALMVLGGALGPGFGACDAAPLCVAGVAQPDIHRRFTWQAWHKLTSTVVLRGRRGT